MDNDSNVIQFNTKVDIKRRIVSGYDKTLRGTTTWIDGSIELAVALCEGKDLFPNTIAFGEWLVREGLNFLNKDDQAAMIAMGADSGIMQSVLEETMSRSYQRIWLAHKSRWERVLSAKNSTPKATSVVEPAIPAIGGQPTTGPTFARPEIQKPVEPAKSIETYEVPKASKLRDMVGDAADVLHAQFKHSRIFIAAFRNEKANTARLFGNYIAKRCQQSDYPQALFSAQTWSLEMVYPHLPKRLVGQLPQVLGTLKNEHSMLAELERLFMATPEFGIVDPPLAAFNKAMSIYNSLKHRKAGGTIDPNAVHKPVYGDDDGKPPVVVRGTKLWPAENTSGYRYDDLRCACGFADGILKAFLEPSDAPISTKTLKLRHIRSWLSGGYNSTGSTFEGTLKAFEAVIHAYTQNVSEEMRNPLPSMIKLDGDAR